MPLTGQERLHVDLGGDTTPVTVDALVAFVAANLRLPGFETAGGTAVAAGTITDQIQAVADLADPSGAA
jgi:hypothetical protein